MTGTGGNVDVRSGSSQDGVSGKIIVSSSDTTVEGGNSGNVIVSSGSAKGGAGGTISLRSGDGGYYDGGDITLSAGQTSGNGFKGGSVHLTGGEGSSSHSTDGGDGGDLIFTGGEAKGEGVDDDGGSISLEGGASFAGHGGSLRLSSGESSATSSGDVCKCILFYYCFMPNTLIVFGALTTDSSLRCQSTRSHSDIKCKVRSRRGEWNSHFEHWSIS